ncbi:MAG TPA: hypothetical protein VII92_17505, partial [Anaerolineae bacterium]
LANGSLDSAPPLRVTRITHIPPRASTRLAARRPSIGNPVAIISRRVGRFGCMFVNVLRYDFITILVMAGAVLLALANLYHL